jgi:hypothetical protein
MTTWHEHKLLRIHFASPSASEKRAAGRFYLDTCQMDPVGANIKLPLTCTGVMERLQVVSGSVGDGKSEVARLAVVGTPKLHVAVVELQLLRRWAVPFVLPQWKDIAVPLLYQRGWVGLPPSGSVVTLTRDAIDSHPPASLTIEEMRWVFAWLVDAGSDLEFIADAVAALEGLAEFCRQDSILQPPVFRRWGLRSWSSYGEMSDKEAEEVFQGFLSANVRDQGFVGIAVSLRTTVGDTAGVANIGYGALRAQTVLGGLAMPPLVADRVIAEGLIVDLDVSFQNISGLEPNALRRLEAGWSHLRAQTETLVSGGK